MLQTGAGGGEVSTNTGSTETSVALPFLEEDSEHEQNHHRLPCYYSVELGGLGREAPPRQEAGCSARGEHARSDEFVHGERR